MVKQSMVIQNPLGLHARPAASFCNMVNTFSSNVTIRKGEKLVNGKSIISVLAGKFAYGDTIEICCMGEDEKFALFSLVKLMEKWSE